MDATPEPRRTVGDQLPWTGMMLDYTEKLAEIVPAELLGWRPEDPSGAFCFSLAEILMHCADARLMFVRQLTGEDTTDGYWTTGEGPGDDGVWSFREHDGKAAIIASLRAARALINEWLAAPESDLLDTTAGTRRVYEQQLEYLRSKELDTAALEQRGPANIMRVLMALTVHETGHRGALQTLLRQKGINLTAE